MKWSPWLRLMRFDKPVGIVLLWTPTAWALWIANQGLPPVNLLLDFFLGTVCMRAAGCVVNDIADRHIDKHVKRTAMRPLTSGEISLKSAIFLLIFLCLVGCLIVLKLPIDCFYYAIFALAITIVYPFCKRFFSAPQLILSIAFSMGIPMAYAASHIPPNGMMGGLFLLNFAWILAYDTIYAMIDRDDDLLIGVKSTAVLFGEHDRSIIGLLQILFHGMWLMLAMQLPIGGLFYSCWVLALFILSYQQYLLQQRTRACYLRAFLSNTIYGMLMWISLF